MNVYISHISALECLAFAQDISPSEARRAAIPRCRKPLPPDCGAVTTSPETLQSLKTLFLSKPVHTLVPTAAARNSNARATCHVRSGTFPPQSFRSIATGICASGPELCFVQAAETLPRPRLIKLGMELCGTYGIPSVGHTDFNRVHPYTTYAYLERFINEIGPVPGAKKARQALPYIVSNSASPMETALVMLLCLPASMGGYALPHPHMNHELRVKQQTLRHVTDKHYTCDLLWKEASLAVEYDSFQYHREKNKLADDAKRRNYLLDRGIIIIPVTTRTIQNLIELDFIAHLVARRLGKRLRLDPHHWSAKQLTLHGMLLNPSPAISETL